MLRRLWPCMHLARALAPRRQRRQSPLLLAQGKKSDLYDITWLVCYIQVLLMLTNPRDAFRGQSRSPNTVPSIYDYVCDINYIIYLLNTQLVQDIIKHVYTQKWEKDTKHSGKNVCETVMFTPMRLYWFKVPNVLKTIAIEKQANLLFITELYVAKLIWLIRAVIKVSV